MKSNDPPKNLKTSRVPYLGLVLQVYVKIFEISWDSPFKTVCFTAYRTYSSL